MRISWLLKILVVLLLAPHTLSAQGTQTPFVIHIIQADNTATHKAGLAIQITLVNTSDHILTLTQAVAHYGAQLDFSISMQHKDGTPAPMKECSVGGVIAENPESEAHCRAVKSAVSYKTVNIQPAQKLQEFAVVSDLYDVDAPGEYVIEVSRRIPNALGGGAVKSNRLNVTLR